MAWPPKIPPCPPPLEEFFREILARLIATWPIDGNGIRCTDGANGRSINVAGGTVAAGASLRPLQLLTATDAFRIVYGTVAGLSTPFSAGDVPPYTLAVTNGHKVYADLTMAYDTGTGVWTATSLAFAAAETIPTATTTHAYHEIGSVSSEGVPASATNGNVVHKRCGDGTIYQDYFQG